VTPDGFRVYPPGETEALFIEWHDYSACTGDPTLFKVSPFVAS
jgi:hypothetical protein